MMISTASYCMYTYTEMVDTAKDRANDANATDDTSELASLAVQYNALLSQINVLAKDASFNGTNLIQATPDDLEVVFNEDGSTDLTISGLDSTTGTRGLNIPPAANDFSTDAPIDAPITDLNTPLLPPRPTHDPPRPNTTGSQAAAHFTHHPPHHTH